MSKRKLTTAAPVSRSALATASLAALAAAGIAAATVSAQSTPSTLHLVSKTQRHVGFMPKGAPHQGSRLGFGDRITGDDHGIGRGVCTVIGRNVLCTLELDLSRGTITAQGILPERASHTRVAITGGTGAYDGARGTALATDVNARESEIDITLRP
jgi:hypothetical protein